MADNKERTAGGNDRKTADGTPPGNKAGQGDSAAPKTDERSRSQQQDQTGKTSQQQGRKS